MSLGLVCSVTYHPFLSVGSVIVIDTAPLIITSLCNGKKISNGTSHYFSPCLEKRSHTLLSNEKFASRIGFVGAAHVLVIYALLMVVKFWEHMDARAARSNFLGKEPHLILGDTFKRPPLWKSISSNAPPIVFWKWNPWSGRTQCFEIRGGRLNASPW